jgi:hypothetical protein
VFVRSGYQKLFKVVASSGDDGYIVVRCPGGLHVAYVWRGLYPAASAAPVRVVTPGYLFK